MDGCRIRHSVCLTFLLMSLAYPTFAADHNTVSEEPTFEILYYESLPPMALTSRSQNSSDAAKEPPSWNWSIEAFGQTFNATLELNNRLIARLPKDQRERIPRGTPSIVEN